MLQSLILPSLAALTLLPSTTLALRWLGPRATPTPSLPDGQGFTPKPTNGPQLHAVLNANPELKLFRRQVQSAYPNTCGYVDGNEAYSFTCSGAYACGYASDNSAFGCGFLIFPFDSSFCLSEVVVVFRERGSKRNEILLTLVLCLSGCSGTSTSANGKVYFTDGCFLETSTTGCVPYTAADRCTGTCAISVQLWYVPPKP